MPLVFWELQKNLEKMEVAGKTAAAAAVVAAVVAAVAENTAPFG